MVQYSILLSLDWKFRRKLANLINGRCFISQFSAIRLLIGFVSYAILLFRCPAWIVWSFTLPEINLSRSVTLDSLRINFDVNSSLRFRLVWFCGHCSELCQYQLVPWFSIPSPSHLCWRHLGPRCHPRTRIPIWLLKNTLQVKIQCNNDGRWIRRTWIPAISGQ